MTYSNTGNDIVKYFEMFWKTGLNIHLAKLTNLYNVEKTTSYIVSNDREIGK